MSRSALWLCGIAAMALAIAAGCQGSPGAGAEGSRELKLAYIMAPGGSAHEAAEHFARLVKEKTGGQVSIKLFHSAQLGNDRELAESVMIGSVDMDLGGAAPIGWYLPQYGAVEAPFMFRDYGHLDRVLKGEIGREVADAFLLEKGIRIIDWWHRGPRYLTTTSRKVTCLEDLKGLKLRVPELPTYIEAWRILGATPTPMTFSEMFMALKQGVVEGQENPIEAITTSSLYEVQKYIMKTEHLLGVYMLMMNDDVFRRLPPDQQTAIQEAAAEAGRHEHDLMIKYDQQFIGKLKEKGMEFVDVDREAFRKALAGELPNRFKGRWAPGFFERIRDTP